MSAALESKAPCPAATGQGASVNLASDAITYTQAREALQRNIGRCQHLGYQAESLARCAVEMLDSLTISSEHERQKYGDGINALDVLTDKISDLIDQINETDAARLNLGRYEVRHG